MNKHINISNSTRHVALLHAKIYRKNSANAPVVWEALEQIFVHLTILDVFAWFTLFHQLSDLAPLRLIVSTELEAFFLYCENLIYNWVRFIPLIPSFPITTMSRVFTLTSGYTAFISAVRNCYFTDRHTLMMSSNHFLQIVSDNTIHMVKLGSKMKASGEALGTNYLAGSGSRLYMNTATNDTAVVFGPYIGDASISVEIDKANAGGGWDICAMSDTITVSPFSINDIYTVGNHL